MRWPRFPLRRRAMLAFGLLAMAVSSLVGLVAYELTRTTLIDQRQRAAERQTFLNARSVSGAVGGELADPATALERVQTSSGGAALLRIDGEWYSNSVNAGRADVPESLLDAIDDGVAARQRIGTPDGHSVAVGLPLAAPGTAYVELVPFSDVSRTLDDVRRGLLVAVVAATVAGLLAGRWLSARVLRPVRRTAAAANEIREGALDRRLERVDDADLEPLVQSFNDMVDGLQSRIERESRFASDVSHELRSPLATMDAALRIARRRVDEPAANDALDTLEAEVDRFRHLVTDLLEIARAEAGVAELAVEDVDPGVLAASVLESTSRTGVALDVGPSAGTHVRLDKRRIGQALVNLLDNADNYGGGATHLRVAGDDGIVRFTVDDAGPGVPDHEKDYVFERFARGSAAMAAGTGLGLALVSEHIRLHGGSVSVHDAPGGGARFVIELPRGTA